MFINFVLISLTILLVVMIIMAIDEHREHAQENKKRAEMKRAQKERFYLTIKNVKGLDEDK